MSVSVCLVARPTRHLRVPLGVTEPIRIAGGRAMEPHGDVFVGIDVAKSGSMLASDLACG